MGRYEDAASILFRRSNSEILKFASELVENHENGELKKAIMTRLNAFKGSEENQTTTAENKDVTNKAEILLEALTSKPKMDCLTTHINGAKVLLNESTSSTDTADTSYTPEEFTAVSEIIEYKEQTPVLSEL